MIATILVCVFSITPQMPTGNQQKIVLTAFQKAKYEALERETTSKAESDTGVRIAGDYLTDLCEKRFGQKPDLKWTLND